MTDDTIRLSVEHDLDYLNDLYLALLVPRKTDSQRTLLKQHAAELKNAVPELTEPEPPPKAKAAPAAKAPADKSGSDKD